MLEISKLQVVQGSFSLRADWTRAPGTITAVIGPSGSGKSTLLSAIAGFLAPSDGRLLWRGTDFTNLAPGDRPVSMLFQDGNLFPHMTAFQNVALALTHRTRLRPAQTNQVNAVLSRVGLAGLGARYPRDLSGGQQGRVALARALLMGRPLLLLDEPFAALGPALRDEMLDLLAEVAASDGLTVIFVTHQPGDALRIAGDTVLVSDGLAHPPMPTQDLFDAPPAALSDYLGRG